MTDAEKKLENLKSDLETIQKIKIRHFINIDKIQWESEIENKIKTYQLKIMSQWFQCKTKCIQILNNQILILKQEIKKK